MANFVRMFKPQFANDVASGAKTQTVRPIPRRMPRCGDMISLRTWSGKPYRSKQRVLREAVIVSVLGCKIDATKGVEFTDPITGRSRSENREAFAKADGFSTWEDMCNWFMKEHGLPFTGILIMWESMV